MKMVEKIQKLIEDRGWTQEAVESWVKLPKSRISKWAGGTGEPSASQALRLARLFGVPLEWLCDEGADWPPEMGATTDEMGILDLYRALGLTKTQALRALSMAAHATPGPDTVVDVPLPKEDNGRERRRRSS